jgi:hypothetical protein
MADNIITIAPAPAPKQENTTHQLNPNNAAVVREKMRRAAWNKAQQVRTPELDREATELQAEVAQFILAHARELLETYMTMFAEYRPLLLALQPILARCGQFQMAASQQVAAQPTTDEAAKPE